MPPFCKLSFFSGTHSPITLCLPTFLWTVFISLLHSFHPRIYFSLLSQVYWFSQSLWLCRSQQSVEISSRYGNIRPPGLPPEWPRLVDPWGSPPILADLCAPYGSSFPRLSRASGHWVSFTPAAAIDPMECWFVLAQRQLTVLVSQSGSSMERKEHFLYQLPATPYCIRAFGPSMIQEAK